jgi:hypothetical protein
MLPAEPLSAEPDRIAIFPPLPFVDEPDKSWMLPLTPLEGAFDVLMLNTPLDFAAPKPEIIENAPPVFSAE